MTDTAHVTLDSYGTVEGRARTPYAGYGEAVFTTAYTGYEESITDPSYTGQILIFSYPLIGNYGVREDRFESREPQVEGVVAREMTDDVAEWLADHGIPAIDHVDTRDLVTYIRDTGHAEAAIAQSPRNAETMMEEGADFDQNRDYILEQTLRGHPVCHAGDGPRIGFIDCGAKQGIIDEFLARDVHLLRYNHAVTVNDILYDDPDLLFVSNGPGNPEWFEGVQSIVQEFSGEKPMAGICLGQQVIALALGGETEKMKFGHHGVNQPVYNSLADQVKMTTQNHSYAVSEPGELTVVEWNVNDDSAEGLRSHDLDILTRQYHPEARPGPNDSKSFFDTVVTMAEGE